MKSWRTTLAGIVTGLVLLLGQAQTMLDDDPKTNPEYSIIIAGVTAIIAGFNARDNVVTSEQAGVGKTDSMLP